MPKLRSLVVGSLALCLAVPAFASTPAPWRAPDAVARGTSAPQGIELSAVLPPVVGSNSNCFATFKVPCSAGDFDGGGTLGGADLGMWLHVFFAGPPYPPAYDLDGQNEVGVNDLSIWLCLYFNCP